MDTRSIHGLVSTCNHVCMFVIVLSVTVAVYKLGVTCQKVKIQHLNVKKMDSLKVSLTMK